MFRGQVHDFLRVSGGRVAREGGEQITAKTTGEFSTGQTLYFHIFILLLYRAYPLLNCVLIELPSMETKLQILWVLFDTLC